MGWMGTMGWMGAKDQAGMMSWIFITIRKRIFSVLV
jgi:hypothetical protein